ncbi:ExeA family protein [Ectothiorhodospira variabilis]|uniref:ExeA family protein n=1 Tax=Ectothiorhodospira variabilis TaxID=505694 RepID=UPI001EFA98D3|nr:ATP-binding protein [Ectothiorhodospira variabilis]MCG5497646.1 ATP-binding protein [Ectothiorhodospira variabilis]
MYREHFGLTQDPLGKQSRALFDTEPLRLLKQRFDWLLEHPGVGLLTGPPGVGKTAALRQLTHPLNPHRYEVIYLAETDFGRLDLYRSLALALGLEPPHRRAALWREIKARLRDMAEQKHLLPLWIIDEAQNLPNEFFRDLPAFINFVFDSQDLMTLWLVGHPNLAQTLQRAPYEALASRLQCHIQLPPIDDPEQFAALVRYGLQQAGVQQQLISDSGLHLLLMASRGRPRTTSQILCTAMKLAVPKGLNHLPDDLLQEAIEALR